MKQIAIARHELPYAIAEELKTLRTNLQFCGEDVRVIMLTSCVSGEGKSMLALEVARSFAELDKQVLLIDADLRKSTLRSRVEEGRITVGLTNYLVGQCAAEEIIYKTETPNVSVAPSGPVPPNPSELLSTAHFADFVAQAKKNYDYVLVDCAPLGMVVDAAVVAPQCDGVVMVIEAGTVDYRMAQDLKSKLENANCPILGVVLNKVDTRNDRYYNYGYGHYGKYGKYGRYYKKRYEEYSH